MPKDLFLWKTMSGGQSKKVALPALKVKESKDTNSKTSTKAKNAKA